MTTLGYTIVRGNLNNKKVLFREYASVKKLKQHSVTKMVICQHGTEVYLRSINHLTEIAIFYSEIYAHRSQSVVMCQNVKAIFA